MSKSPKSGAMTKEEAILHLRDARDRYKQQAELLKYYQRPYDGEMFDPGDIRRNLLLQAEAISVVLSLAGDE